MNKMSVEDKYNDFFEKREHQKKNLYRLVISRGLLMSAVGGFCATLGFTFSYVEELWLWLFVVGDWMFAVGVCIVSTVPVDEFDIDNELSKDPRLERIVSMISGFSIFLIGFHFSTYAPYLPGASIAIFGISIFLHTFDLTSRLLCNINQNEVLGKNSITNTCRCKSDFVLKLTQKLFIGLNLVYSFWISQIIVGLIDPIYLSTFNWLQNWLFPDFYAKNLSNAKSYIKNSKVRQISDSFRIFIVVLSFFAMTFCFLKARSEFKKQDNSGWSTTSVYVVLRSFLVTSGIIFLLCSFAIFEYDFLISRTVSVTYFLSGFVSLGIVIAMHFYGLKRSFTFVARYFEYDIKRLQEDGAFLAYLAKSTQSLDLKSKVYWIHRYKPLDEVFTTNTHYVDRNKWMKGDLIETPDATDKNTMLVEISYEEDRDLTWNAKYEGGELVYDPPSTNFGSVKTGSINVLPISEDDWLTQNFHNSGTSFITSGRVQRLIDFPPSGKDQYSLLEWAKSNLRRFKWEKFDDNFLKFSPRELANDEQKKAAFDLSESIVVAKESDKIDFFMSHSWVGNPVMKCKVLREFANDYLKKNRKYPTLWFDKVCIDQKAPGDHLEVLPINIGACKKILILLDKTYIERIWCIWEVFTLLTFCNKELALERIEALLVPSEENETVEKTEGAYEDLIKRLKTFDFDNAHCYDPNEEFKLREIISNVGIGRLNECLKLLAKMLEEKRPQKKSVLNKGCLTTQPHKPVVSPLMTDNFWTNSH